MRGGRQKKPRENTAVIMAVMSFDHTAKRLDTFALPPEKESQSATRLAVPSITPQKRWNEIHPKPKSHSAYSIVTDSTHLHLLEVCVH